MATAQVTGYEVSASYPPATSSVTPLHVGKLVIIQHMQTIVPDIRMPKILDKLQEPGMTLYGRQLLLSARINFANNSRPALDISRMMIEGLARAAIAQSLDPDSVVMVLPRKLIVDGWKHYSDPERITVGDFKDRKYSDYEVDRSKAAYNQRSHYLENILMGNTPENFLQGLHAHSKEPDAPNLLVVTNSYDFRRIEELAGNISGANVKLLQEKVMLLSVGRKKAQASAAS